MSVFKSNRFTVSNSRKPGKVIVTALPPTGSVPGGKPKTWSPAQKEHLNRVQAAKEYARMAISDPVLNDYYAAKAARIHGIGAWHLAIKDFYKPPTIHGAGFHGFSGKMGDVVTIEASDNFEVKRVTLTFASESGVILAAIEGEEVLGQLNWACRLDADIDLQPGMVVVVGAMDIPGNITTVELIWPFNCKGIILFEPKDKRSGRGGKSQLRIRI